LVIFLVEIFFSIEFFSKKGKLVTKYCFGKMSKSGSDFYFIFVWGGEGGMFTLCGEKCFEKGIFFQKYPVSWGKKTQRNKKMIFLFSKSQKFVTLIAYKRKG